MESSKREWWHENHHLVEAWIWVILVIPSFVWWKDNVFWVILISLYANYKTAISAHEGRQARKAVESNGD